MRRGSVTVVVLGSMVPIAQRRAQDVGRERAIALEGVCVVQGTGGRNAVLCALVGQRPHAVVTVCATLSRERAHAVGTMSDRPVRGATICGFLWAAVWPAHSVRAALCAVAVARASVGNALLVYHWQMKRQRLPLCVGMGAT